MPEPSGGELTTDRDLVVRSWDEWLSGATGIPAAEATGVALTTLFPELEARGFLPVLRRVLDLGMVELLSPALHGYLLPCPPAAPSVHFARMQQRVTLSPLREGTEVTGLAVRIEDVTPRRERERELAARLRSGTEDERLSAAEALHRDGAAAAVLVDGFRDSSWRVRRAAADGAAGDPSDEAAGELVRLIREQHRDIGVLNAALTALSGSEARVLPRLIPLLREEDADVRTYAALALGLLGEAGPVPALLSALEDEDSNVRFHAAEALGRLRSGVAVDALVRLAESRDFGAASAAVEALALIGDSSVLPRLLPLLEDPFLEPAVLAALGALGGEEVVDLLTARLTQGDVSAPAAALARIFDRLEADGPGGGAVAALARDTLPAEGVQRVLAAARDAAEERPAILRVASWLEDPEVEDLLIDGLADPGTYPAALDGLARRGAGAADVLLQRLPSLEGAALTGAVEVLGRIGSRGAVPALLTLAGGADADVAVAALGALGSIGDSAAVEGLFPLLDAPSPAVRQAAVGAISAIGHPDTAARVEPLLRDPSPRRRESAARIAGYFGYPQCLDGVLRLASDPDPVVRRAAVEHLAAFDHPRAAGRLAEALQDAAPQVRAAAVRALALGDGTVVSPLVAAALADADPWVRYFAARAAGALRVDALGEPLARAACHDDADPVRIAAAEALGALGGEEAIAVLGQLAADPHPELSLAALGTLAAVDGRGEHPVLGDALQSADPARQLAVLEALGEAGPRIAGEVVRAAESRTREVRRAAVSLLLRGGAVQAVLGLGEHPRRADDCLELLVHAAPHLVQQLGQALLDPREAIRTRAAQVLLRSGCRSAVPHLTRALEDPSVRCLAQLALQRLDLRDAALAAPAGGESPHHASLR